MRCRSPKTDNSRVHLPLMQAFLALLVQYPIAMLAHFREGPRTLDIEMEAPSLFDSYDALSWPTYGQDPVAAESSGRLKERGSLVRAP
jgi:hypothetical protein